MIIIVEINAEILDTELIHLDEIIDDYFDINPPFEEGEKKRKEFPDAFIANQIRNRFGESEDVAIVSNDNGFKKACKETKNHFFFNSLGELFNTINKDKNEAYSETISVIKELQFCINSAVLEHIKSNENIDVRGLSYDKDGIAFGFDYDEYYLHKVSNVTFMINSVDEMSDQTSKVTLLCTAKISADCFYEDYDNAPWDSEIKDYVFVDTIQMREEHCARFGCRIEIDRKEKTFNIFPFTIVLGEDSRKNRYKIDEQLEVNYEQEIQDMDRRYLGFQPLGSYQSYLEEDLIVSNLNKDIIEQFEKINALYRKYDDFCIDYDSLQECLNDSDYRTIIKTISAELSNLPDFPNIVNIENIQEAEIEGVRKWVAKKLKNAHEIAEEETLPDTLNYGESIIIKGIDGSKMTFTIDEIEISPTEGDEETINIHLLNGQGIKINGYITLKVGYLNFDDDGGVSDGRCDEIEYEYQDILEDLKKFVIEQNRVADEETKIVGIIATALYK